MQNGFDFSFDFSGLSFKTDPETEDAAMEIPKLSPLPVAFSNAEDFAEQVDITKDYFGLLSGSFIFGDFIEALVFQKRLKPSVMFVSTLGLSDENADSMVNLTDCLGCQQVNLIVSHYFAATERHRLMPYMRDAFAGQPIDVAVLQSHAKICLIRSEVADFVIAGSANLSSSNNVEQIIILHDPALLDFLQERLAYIMDRFKVYRGMDETPKLDWSKNKKNTGRYAWQAINREEV